MKKIKFFDDLKVAFVVVTLAFMNNAFSQNCLPQSVAESYVTSQKITEGYDYFISKGFTNSEIVAEFGSSTNPAIYTAYVIIKFVNDNQNTWILDENNYIVNSSTPPDAYHCALEAFGILGIAQLLSGTLTKEGMLTIIRKVAPKALGAIGAAWAIYDFGECMGWWGIAQHDIDFGELINTNNYTYCE